jgi:hypothetical protein
MASLHSPPGGVVNRHGGAGQAGANISPSKLRTRGMDVDRIPQIRFQGSFSKISNHVTAIGFCPPFTLIKIDLRQNLLIESVDNLVVHWAVFLIF